MKHRIFIVSGVILVAGIAASVVPGYLHTSALRALADETRAHLIFVQGGAFVPGEYDVIWRNQDGTLRDYKAPDTAQDTLMLDGFYMQPYEADNVVFDLFLKDTGRPAQVKIPEFNRGAPGFAAEMAWGEATSLCAWLGGLTGLQMRLPSEAEWEYAARARVHSPPYATDNGQHLAGENIHATQQGSNPPAIGVFGPSPLGFFNMADGLYEWTAEIEGTGLPKVAATCRAQRLKPFPPARS